MTSVPSQVVVGEDVLRRIISEEFAKHRVDLLSASGAASAAAAAEAAAAAAKAAAAISAAAAKTPKEVEGLGIQRGSTGAGLQESQVITALYRQFGLVLGEIQAGDEASAVARIRGNLRTLSGLSSQPNGWVQYGAAVEGFAAESKTLDQWRHEA